MSTQEKFYIQIDENGNAINHPAFESNLLEAFPNGIPSNWELFEHTIVDNRPRMWDVLKRIYTKINGVWTNTSTYIPMSETERAEATIIYFNQLKTKKNNFLEVTDLHIQEKNDAQDFISVSVLNEYKTQLTAWDPETVILGESFEDFCMPPFPNPPVKQDDGSWVAA
jgi:hypothetical protein